MTALATIEQILAEGLDPAYVVFALPDWEHFHPTELPAPIAEWIARNCPDVEVRRISTLPSPGAFLFDLDDQFHDEITSALEIAPVFLIGFNEEQADAFAAAWSKPDGSPSDHSEFYFCYVASKEDTSVRQYDAQGGYCIPNFPSVCEHDGDHSA